MESTSFLISAVYYLAAAAVLVPLTSRLGLGSVLGYLLSGMLIGPKVLGLIQSPTQVLSFAEFGVVLFLFIVGLELEPKKVWSLRKQIIGMGGLQVTTGIICITAVAYLFTKDYKVALVFALGAVMSSTALALQLLKERGLNNTIAGTNSFSVLLFQDLAVIPVLATIPFLATSGAATGGSWLGVLKSIGAILFVLFLGRYIVQPVFRFIAKTNLREMFTAVSLLLILGIAVLMHAVGLSMALGSFLAGVLLANSEYRHELEVDIEPFKGLLLGLFFVGVGMSINLSLMVSSPVTVLCAVVALLLIKAVLLYFIARTFRFCGVDNWVFTLALSQGGEFAFVVFNSARLMSVLTEAQNDFFVLVIALSMLATPFLFLLFERFVAPRFNKKDKREMDMDFEEKREVILAGFGRMGQVVGRLLFSQKIKVTILEKDPEQIEFLRRFGWTCYYGDVTRLDLLRAAGADTAKLLILAIDDMEAAVQTVEIIKQNFPNLKVVARASTRPDAWYFMKEKIPVVRELLEGGLELGSLALQELNYLPFEAKRAVDQFRVHDRKALAKSAQFQNDQRSLITLAQQQREELARIIEVEEKRHEKSTNLGWGEN